MKRFFITMLCAAFCAAAAGAATLTASQDGEWGNAATWGGDGVPDATSDVVIAGRKVTHSQATSIEAASLTLSGAAKLVLWGEATAVRGATPPAAIASTDADLSLSIGGDVSLSGSSWMTVGGLGSAYRPTLGVGGDLALSGTAAMAVYAGTVAEDNLVNYAKGGAHVEVAGTLSTASGTWITPFSNPTNGASAWFEARDVVIAAGGGFNAVNAGYSQLCGPGCPYPLVTNGSGREGYGGSYGGQSGFAYNEDRRMPTYGYAAAPFWAGSPGIGAWGNYADKRPGAGGAILIRATRKATIAGTLNANGPSNTEYNKLSWGNGSGGSVWIIAQDLEIVLATASISVSAGTQSYGGCSPSGGGRIAFTVGDTSDTAFADFVTTGESSLFRAPIDLTDPSVSSYASVVAVKAGTNSNSYWRNKEPKIEAEDGTAVVLYAKALGAPLNVTVSPSPADVTLPVSSPIVGRTMASGLTTATADPSSFVPGTDSRQRRNCTGYTYSNSLETVASGATLSCTFDADAAAEHWLEWDYGDLEHLLRVTEIVGSGTVSAAESWHDAGTTTTLTATPSAGWTFLCWTGEIGTDASPAATISLTMDAPRDVQAIFIPETSAASLSAVKDGEWLDVATWGGEAVPGPTTDVSIQGRKVTHSYTTSISAKSLSLSGAAKLFVFGAGSSATGISPIGAGDGSILALSVGGDVSLAGSSQMSLGGLNSSFRPQLVVGGDILLAGTAQLATYAGFVPGTQNDLNVYDFPASTNWYGDGALVSAGRDLNLATGTKIHVFCHETYGTSPRFTVGRNVEIASGATVNAQTRGWAAPNGPGFYFTKDYSDGHGGSHGGNGANDRGAARTVGTAYGRPYAPFLPGSPARGRATYETIWSIFTSTAKSQNGGGVIRIHAARDISLAGLLDASCAVKNPSGAGGSVWLTCRKFLASEGAAILAHGGDCTAAGTHGAGGGGRVAVMTGAPSAEQLASLYATGLCQPLNVVTTNVNDAASFAYPSLIDVKGGNNTTTYNNGGWDGEDGTAAILDCRNARTLFIVQ